MTRDRLRNTRAVAGRCDELRAELRAALAKLPEHETDPAVVDAVWRGEALGTLLWALALAELPDYDTPFDYDTLLGIEIRDARLRPAAEITQARDTARLWHWRARTTRLQADSAVALPEPWQSFDQLIAATAMHGFEAGLLPAPLRGDFRAFDKVYRQLDTTQYSVAHSIAIERHRALNWLCGRGSAWDDVPTDT